ncbi:MAG: Exopolysaccharide biosynthesis polyprenyl glycosylphosphotransferase [Marmoricola sp.]|jgi:exopolysaccharide biosynthesis polyprenyl glycosylphosphotransferase|nr:Exopolysaccharide biosynthesis polyprenyl glycosylphosphotransferase [Marmoricola sp.]
MSTTRSDHLVEQATRLGELGHDASPSRRAARSLQYLPWLALGVDMVSIAVALGFAAWGRAHLGLFAILPQEQAARLGGPALVIGAGWIVTTYLLGGYQSKIFGAGTTEFRRVTNAGLVTSALVGIGCFLLKYELPRGFFVLAVAAGFSLLLLGRLLLRYMLKKAHRNGTLLYRTLIVGSAPYVDEVAAVLSRDSSLGYRVIGALTTGGGTETTAGIPVIGSVSEVTEIARQQEADVVFFAGGSVDSAAQLRRVAWELEDSATQVLVAPTLTDVSHERIQLRPVGGLPLIHLEKPRSALARRKAKRTFDLVGSSLLLMAFSPIFAFIALQIWMNDRGPIYFKQVRIGRDGTSFRCWKFRTMAVDAESRLAEVLAANGTEHNVFAKLKVDPRITRPGRWLRRLSLDELPQLINVLRGEMSLVGPRPQVADEVALYDNAMARRLHVSPGMTGLWQVSGRSDLSVDESIRLDLYYVDNWSMFQDLSILGRTFGAVFNSRGAY